MTPFLWLEYLTVTGAALIATAAAAIIPWLLWQSAIGWLREGAAAEVGGLARPRPPVELHVMPGGDA